MISSGRRPVLRAISAVDGASYATYSVSVFIRSEIIAHALGAAARTSRDGSPPLLVGPTAASVLHTMKSTIEWVRAAVVGAGPAGLAASRELARAGAKHLVLERGRIGSSWRTQRWDSFRLNTPMWMNRVPGEFLDGP